MTTTPAPLTFEAPPDPTDATPTRDEIAAALAARPGAWAVVARPDRAARADAMASRVNGGREYGPGHEARVVKIGPEFRVYARNFTPDDAGYDDRDIA